MDRARLDLGPLDLEIPLGAPIPLVLLWGCRSDGRAEEAEQADEETHQIAEAWQFDGAHGRTFLCLCNWSRICLCDDN